MSQLDACVSHCHQPRPGERAEQRLQVRGLVGVGRQLGDRDPSARVVGALAELGQPHEDVAGKGLLRGIEPTVDRLGGAGDGAPHAARVVVPVVGQHPSPPPLPGLEQRMGQQGQGPGLPGQVLHDHIGETRFQPETGDTGGPLDGRGHLLVGHRAHQCGTGLDQRRQPAVGAAVAVEVAADGEHHRRDATGDRRGVDERVDELPALPLVAAQREELLELVDHHHDPRPAGQAGRRLASGQIECPGVGPQVVEQRARRDGGVPRQVRGQLRQRVRPRGHQHRGPRRAARQRVVGQGRDHARPDQGRLAGPRRADHGQQTGRRQPVDERGHRRVAPEEQPAVLGLERDQPLVGRLRPGALLGPGRRRLVEDLDRGNRVLQSLEGDRPGVGEGEPAAGGDELAHEVGGDDLARRRDVAQASGDHHRGPEEVVLVAHGLAHVQPDPHLQGLGRGPVALGDGALHRQGARHRAGSRRERHH